jgi:hypothetical protein
VHTPRRTYSMAQIGTLLNDLGLNQTNLVYNLIRDLTLKDLEPPGVRATIRLGSP